MPSVTYMNQSAPFWDFIASLEQQSNTHPHPNDNTHDEGGRDEDQHRQAHDDPFANAWGLGNMFGGGRAFPYRGYQPAPTEDERSGEANKEKDPEKVNERDNEKNGEKHDSNNDNGEGPSGTSGSDNEIRRGNHGRCGGRRRGHCGSGGFGGGPRDCAGPWGRRGPHFGPPHHGPPHHGPGPHHGPPHHGHHHGGPRGFGHRGGWGPWARGGGGFPFNSSFDPTTLVTQFMEHFTDTHPSKSTTSNNNMEDHVPDADIFDTETAYIIHLSLPGAKKEDVGVNWDAEKSELSVAGVIYRVGDEEFLKTLAVGERKVGAFERKIRLGTRATPARVDEEGIVAKLEDGVLRIEVPKEEDGGFVEVRKVDIE